MWVPWKYQAEIMNQSAGEASMVVSIAVEGCGLAESVLWQAHPRLLVFLPVNESERNRWTVEQ
jgi:hypothetical protein